MTITDSILIGLQCIALIPGVSRSGATISAGLVGGLDRVAATRMSFFLSIPALLAAGLFELKDAWAAALGGPTLVGTVVSFVVAYGAIAWCCCGSSPATRSPGSCPTGSCSASRCSSLLATGVITAT